jgi:anaerobic magnesium-protoporphyrin IX monomethyl ester cyclase
MKVLLTTINSKYIHQNLAIRLLYELNQSEADLYVKEFTHMAGSLAIANYCSSFQMVAFSCYIWNITQTLEVAKLIKQQNPNCLICLGGPEVSYEWDEIIGRDDVDFIIAGEGEIPFARLLRLFPNFESVPALIWKRNGEVIVNRHPDLFDLNKLANINPYQSLSPEEIKNKILYIETSRGCPHRCGYCLAGTQNKLRYLPWQAVQANLLYLMERGKTIKFLDRTFNTSAQYAISVFKFIIEHYKPGNVFQFEIKADVLQPELIEFVQMYVPKGIFRFEIGIQTLNAESNKEINRKLDFENIKNFTRQVADKVDVHVDLIVGLPNDYWNDIKYSFDEVFKLFAPELQLGFLKFLKGTPIREQYREHGYQFNQSPPYQIISSHYLSALELEKIEFVEHALDIYWNKKRAANTLKYIAQSTSAFDFLLGLGTYFQAKNNFNKVELSEVYTTLLEFVAMQYPNNSILSELVALDYYLQYKIKPRSCFLPDIDPEIKPLIIEKHGLNLQQYRYAMHPIHFSLTKFLNAGVVEPMDGFLIIEYSGVDWPRIV